MNRLFFTILFGILPLFGSATAAQACSVCQGNPDSDLTKGAQAGVIMMVGVTYILLLGVAGIVVSWVVRARRMGRPL